MSTTDSSSLYQFSIIWEMPLINLSFQKKWRNWILLRRNCFHFFHNCVITSAYRNVWAFSHVGTCTVQTRRKSHMREALQCHRAMAGVMLVVVPIQGENVPSALLVKSWSIYRWWTTNKYIYKHTYTKTEHIRGSPVPDLVFLFGVFK